MVDHDSDTAPLDRKYLTTITIHDRLFQQYAIENLIYFVPIDEDEEERLAIQHNVLNKMFDGRLVFPPLASLRKVLDCGYGSAAWAAEVAEQFPSTEVVGVDISPHMKQDDTPENLEAQLDDLNQTFTFPPNTFDLVHSRLVAGGINKSRWPTYLRDIVRVLRPGGWLQMVEIYYNCQSYSGSMTDGHALRQWSSKYLQSLDDVKDLRAPMRIQALMTAAGLVNLEHRMIELPLCGWSNNPRDRQIGEMNRENVHRLLGSLALYPFTQRLGMTLAAFQALIAQARTEAADPSLKAYFPLYVCIGRKPGG